MNEEMNRKKRIIVSVVAITILTLTLIGITYAYFLTRIKGNTNDKSIDIKTANLFLEYTDGNGIIEPTDVIIPGDPIDTKTFSVENKGDETISEYGVYLEDIVNEFEHSNDVKIKLTCKEVDAETEEFINDCDNELNNVTFPKLNSLIVKNSIDPKVRHDYELTVTYSDTGENQSNDMNKKLRAKVQIYDYSDVIELSGSYLNYEEGDYIELSNIDNDSTILRLGNLDSNDYKFVGLKPSNYTLTIKNNTEGVITVKETYSFTINRDQSESITNNIINVTENTKKVFIDINNGLDISFN